MENVVIELDCQRVVMSEFGNILRQCRTLLIELPNYLVRFVRRQANLVAHNFLARDSIVHAGHQNFLYIPSCIHHLILNEMI